MRLIHKAAQFINQLIAAFGIMASSRLFVFTYLDVIIADVRLSPVTALSPDAPSQLAAPTTFGYRNSKVLKKKLASMRKRRKSVE